MFRQHNLAWEVSLDFLTSRLGQAMLLAATLLLLLTALPRAEAQSRRCVLYGRIAGNVFVYYWEPNSGFIQGSLALYLDRSCAPPVHGHYHVGSDGKAIANDEQTAIEICNSGNGKDNSVRRTSGWYDCRPKKRGGGSGSGGSGSGDSYEAPQPKIAPTQLPLADVQVAAERGAHSGIQFQRFDHYAVGIQSVVDMGILDLVDVWGQADQYFEVCFPQHGAIVFLDAATSPRSVVTVTSFQRDGLTCGAMNRAGTMVLVKSTSKTSSSDVSLAQEFIDATSDPVDSAIELENCMVTPEHNLNLRDEPWGDKLTVVPDGTTVSASARTKSWFLVMFELIVESDEEPAQPLEGWIAAWLSESEGDCSWESTDSDEGPALASNRDLSDEVTQQVN